MAAARHASNCVGPNLRHELEGNPQSRRGQGGLELTLGILACWMTLAACMDFDVVRITRQMVCRTSCPGS